MRIRMLILASAVLLAAPAPAAASDGGAASITGSVVSMSGAGLPGASITIAEQGGEWSAVVAAGERGLFKVESLRPAAYVVTAEARGFTPASALLTLSPGDARSIELRLAPSTLAESVTVTAAAPRDSLEAAEIRESPARDVGEALATTPGVWALRKGGIANEVVVRGMQSRDLNVLIDGQRIYGACPNHMDPPAFHVDFSEVDRVEVSKGPFDVRHEGSLGGVVNVVTRRPESGLHASPNMAAGSWGYVNPSATLSYGRDEITLLGGYSFRSSEPYADGSGKRFTESAGYRPESIGSEAFRVGTGWAKAWFRPAEGHAVQVSWTRQTADHVLYPYLMMDAIDDDTDRAQVTYDAGAENAPLRLSAQVYYARVDHWMTDAYRTSSAGAPRGYSMGSMAGTRTAGGRVEATIHKAIVGVEVSRRSWDVATYMARMQYEPQYTVPDVTADFAGAYAETSVPLSARWTFNAGARLDHATSAANEGKAPADLYEAYNGTRSTSRSDVFPSGNVRFVWRNDGGAEIGAGIGRTGRVPEPNERYLGLKRMGSDWVGNPDLDPSLNTGVDLSFTLRRSGLYLGASLFGEKVHDLVTLHGQPRVRAVPGVMNTIARSYVNNDADLWGGEISAAISMTRRISVSGEVSYVRGTQQTDPSLGITSGDLAEMPPLRARSSMRFNAARAWAEIEGVFSASQRRVDADLLEEETPGWGIANVKGGAMWRSLDLSLGVSNVFDRAYTEHLSYQRDPYRSGARVREPGRGLFGNVTYRF